MWGNLHRPVCFVDMGSMVEPLTWTHCSCGRDFATLDGFNAHKISLHDAEPNPQENKINDDNLRREVGLDAAHGVSGST